MKLNQLKAALDGVLLTDTEFVNFKQSAIKNSKGDNVKKMVEVTVVRIQQECHTISGFCHHQQHAGYVVAGDKLAVHQGPTNNPP